MEQSVPQNRPMMMGNMKSFISATPNMYRDTTIMSVVTVVFIVLPSVSFTLTSQISARVCLFTPILLRFSLILSNTTTVSFIA